MVSPPFVFKEWLLANSFEPRSFTKEREPFLTFACLDRDRDLLFTGRCPFRMFDDLDYVTVDEISTETMERDVETIAFLESFDTHWMRVTSHPSFSNTDGLQSSTNRSWNRRITSSGTFRSRARFRLWQVSKSDEIEKYNATGVALRS